LLSKVYLGPMGVLWP